MKKLVILTAFCLLTIYNLMAQTTGPQYFLASGDFIFTPPPGVTHLIAELWGAGGGGNPFTGYGGGGGAFTKAEFDLNGKTSIRVHVGQGGTSAQSGEQSSVGYDSAGVRYAFGIAKGGTGVYGNGGAASAVSGFTTASVRGGNGSYNFSVYYGAGGGAAYYDGSHDAPTPTTAACQFGVGVQGTQYPYGKGGNGAGPSCTQTAGNFPGGGGGSGSAGGSTGATGQVLISWVCPTASPIGQNHTVPFPQEKNPDYLADAVGSLASPTGNGLVYSWQDSSSLHTWTTATGSTNDVKYALPSFDTTRWFRRVSNICNIPNQYSNTVKINVVRKDIIWPDKLGTTGSITGFIISQGGNAVKGDSVIARKRIDLNGSTKDYTYYAVTDNQGKFVLDSMFYGKQNNGDGDPTQVSFYIKPVKYNHVFDITDSFFYDIKLDVNNYDQTVKNGVQSQAFKDLTAVSIIGKTYQQCDDCLLADMVTVGSVQRDLDSVDIYSNNLFKTKTSKDINGHYGSYTVTLDDITQSYTITPKAPYRKFDTTGSTIKTQQDVLNFNFRDTATHLISGTVRAGCNEIIGQATLLFTDIPQSPERDPVFNKKVITQTNGNYAVRMPAGKYKVKMIDFTPMGGGLNLQKTNVINFFSGDSITSAISTDSLKVFIDTANRVLNLTYQRPPTLQLTGMDSTCATILGQGYAVWKLNDYKPLQVKVFQGPAASGCPLSYDSVRIYTTIQTDNVEEMFVKKVDTGANRLGIAFDTLKVGVPNITGDHTKSFKVTYEDKYGNTAELNRKVVATGTRGRPGQTFETVTPLMPLLVLHDPPGDGSSATWSQTKTTETAMRMFNNKEGSNQVWVEAKLGVAFSTEVGFIASVSTDFAAWASINASAALTSRNSSENELIVHTEVGTTIQTSPTSDGIGDNGDIFYGGAMNIVYGISDEVSVNSCVVSSKEQPIFAPNKIKTTYAYTKQDILNSVDNLRLLATQTGNPDSVRYFNNQANVWQQMLDNNERNKANAPFVENKTFTGGGSSLQFTSSSSSTSTNSVEFGLEVDASFAAELGIEVAGSGVKGGVIIDTKIETGASTTNTATTNTQISYTLTDQSPGDKFTVDIKKDPVYGTPVFNTIAGLSSCPAEDKTIARDEMALTVNTSEVTNQPAGSGYTFTFTCANTSVDAAAKNYTLYLDDNLDGAIINNGSTSYSQLITGIPKNGTKTQSVTISRPNSSNASYSFKNLKFILADNCSGTNLSNIDPRTSRVQLVSIDFASPCSGINLSEPSNGWVSKAVNNSKLQILFDGYTVANLTGVILQYRVTGGSSWNDATSTARTASQLSGTTNYSIDWDVANLADGKYDVRMKLFCSSGVVYSKSASGIIDRKAPSLFGKPEPTDDNYAAGDVISFNYDENIDISNLNTNKVELYRMSNNSLIPVTVSGSGNKIVILPSVNLLAYVGDSVKVVVSNIADLNGNVRTTSDIATFTIGTVPIVFGGNKVKVYMVTPSLAENASGKMEVHFKLIPDVGNKIRVTKVNFSIGGTAILKKDYDTSFNVVNTVVNNPATGVNESIPLYSSFNGSSGYVYIDSATKEAVLKFDPIGDTVYEPNETIIINLASGGDYTLTDSLTATATILNDDLQPPVVAASGPLDFCNGGSVILTAATPNIVTRWANSVIAFSDQYSANEWSAAKATGEPDVYPQYGDIQYAWSPTNPDNAREYLVLGYSDPAPVNFVDIYETYNPGAIDTVYVKNATTGAFVNVYTNTAAPAGDSSRILHITFPTTAYNVSGVRIAMKSSIVPGFNEIDAVGIGLDTTYTSYLWSTGAITKNITVNSAGDYFVIGKNSIGQTAKSNIVKVRKSATAATFITANSACSNPGSGAIQINATGGISPYYYKFDSLPADKFQASKVLKPLKAGTYKVTIKDSIECIITTGNIVITSPVAIAGTFTKTDATCIGKANGTITITATGGKAPYGYKIGLNGNYNDANVITGLTAGTYTIYIKDANGCIGSAGPITVGQANVTCLSVAANNNAANELKQTGMALVLTPNPAREQFTLRVFTDSKEAVQLRVLDVNGKNLFMAKGQPEQAFKFGESFVPGTYLVEVRQGDTVKTVKAVKMR